jgi:hypothetical protein
MSRTTTESAKADMLSAPVVNVEEELSEVEKQVRELTSSPLREQLLIHALRALDLLPVMAADIATEALWKLPP